MSREVRKFSTDQWFFKVLASVFLGSLLVCGMMGVVGVVCHTDGNPRTASAQYLMWMAALVWSVVLSGCFLFRSGWQAWGVLALANSAAWGLFSLLRSVMA
ncbi:hypothetical protein [Acetobacter orleanensis]|uniref:hypothetical protein n=1 Tax=Acetobacter orleanensis TaxID=104099 RepID=UPI000662B190|nr:hypothetical protein [Acetobacter orleanensis]KXV63926.1 hypothetical protein AD949_06370 [Acetobacter orleanensis]PCD79697.1 hypothetical protein CO710_05690 [Acetobacter orleanensis]